MSINLIKNLYYSKFISTILHNSLYWLRKELKDCYSVLDLGCGYNSLLKYQRLKFSVGVDYFMPYLLESKNKSIHNFYIRADVKSVEFRPSSFDAVLLLNVLEHLKKEEALKVLEKAFRIAKRKVILITPNGYLKQVSSKENPLQEHQSGWQVKELLNLGFKPYGLAGFKFFRKDIHYEDRTQYIKMATSTMRFKPALFWLLFAEATQIIAWLFPQYTFEVFYVKNKYA
ncbi:MAG: class I SAM-dependent methyltransferase [Candidatus Omnitrophica bacterium]|nr:class I SAM-dependent methyltransferase [Candidatus Omnitrophota bacterium]MCM8799786.1 class I SAM-dependent methyltransferase [Candidatus Omnitrophota bacterium]